MSDKQLLNRALKEGSESLKEIKIVAETVRPRGLSTAKKVMN